MSIQQAEELKKQWTDKYVTVAAATPELRRFDGLLGQVKTVNMNGRLLVEFDGTADIAWYDIDPAFLKIADPAAFKPRGPAAGDGHAKPKTAAKADAAPPAKPASSGTNPLDMVRKQASGSSATPTPTAVATAKPKASGGTSPLDLIRKQSKAAPAGTPQPAMSPLDQIRQKTAASPASGTNVTDEASGATFRGAAIPKPDNLKIVEGIGPKIEELLHNAEIKTWQHLAEQQPEHVKGILEAAGPRFKMHDPSTWPTQAKLAADGRWEELEEYQDTLQAGREG